MTDRPFSDAVLLELRVSAPAPAEEIQAARRVLNTAIAREAAGAARPRRRWLLAAASGAAAVVVALAAVLTVTSLRAPSARALLSELVTVASQSRPITQTEGEFVYLRSEGELVQGAPLSVPRERAELQWLQPFTLERWVAGDGSFRLRRQSGEPRFFSAADAELAASDPLLAEFARAGEEVFDSEPQPDEVAIEELPLQVDALRAAIVAGYALDEGRSRPLEVELADRVAELILRHDAAPDLRAALLRVLAGVDALDVVDRGSGTFTVGVSYDTEVTGERLRLEFVFDEQTSLLVERRVVYLEPGPQSSIPPGTVSYERFAPPRVVDELGP